MIAISLIALSACQKKYNTPIQLCDVIRQEEDITTDEKINYVGSCAKDGYALLWYISGDDIYNLEYIPAACYFTSENKYIFIQTYKPMDRGDNIAVLQWHGGYSFLVNNTECKQIKIRKADKIKITAKTVSAVARLKFIFAIFLLLLILIFNKNLRKYQLF